MQSNLALYVRSRTRLYEPATSEQVLQAAQLIVDARMHATRHVVQRYERGLRLLSGQTGQQ